MAKQEAINIQVTRFLVCNKCSVAKKAAEQALAENPAHRVAVVSDCVPADLQTGVDATIVAFELTPHGEGLFNREEIRVRISDCPGRTAQRQRRLDEEMGMN